MADLYRQDRKSYANIRCETVVVDDSVTVAGKPVFNIEKATFAHKVNDPTAAEAITAGTKGTWQVRAIESVDDPANLITIAGNTITFDRAGDYFIEGTFVTYGCGKALIRLRQTGGSIVEDKEYSTSVDTSSDQAGTITINRILYGVLIGDQLQFQQQSEHDAGDTPGPPDYANAAYGVTYHPNNLSFKSASGVIQRIG